MSNLVLMPDKRKPLREKRNKLSGDYNAGISMSKHLLYLINIIITFIRHTVNPKNSGVFEG
jgi:hypothetical protein